MSNGAEDLDDRLLVANEHPLLTVDVVRMERIARAVLEGEACTWTYIGIVFDTHDAIHTLNRDYLAHDYQTDVLSFLIDETADGIEGEVYVDLDTAVENADRFGTSFADETARYVVHGLLHLAGHDDSDDERREAMRRLEDLYLLNN